MSFVVLVYGGRDYSDRGAVSAALDDLLLCGPRAGLTVLSGAAPGADWLALEWAIDNGVFFIAHPADWDTHRPADPRRKNPAGPIRNQAMLDTWHPDMAIEFPGGWGTADMRRRCLKAGVEVEVTERLGA